MQYNLNPISKLALFITTTIFKQKGTPKRKYCISAYLNLFQRIFIFLCHSNFKDFIFLCHSHFKDCILLCHSRFKGNPTDNLECFILLNNLENLQASFKL